MAKASNWERLLRLLRGGEPPRKRRAGLSRRQLAFRLFDAGESHHSASEQLNIKEETCRRYYHAWKKLPADLEQMVRVAEGMLRSPQDRDMFVHESAKTLDLPPEEVEQILLRPWGARSIILACHGLKKIVPAPSEKEKAALNWLLAELTSSGNSIKDVLRAYETREKLRHEVIEQARAMFDPDRLSSEQKEAIMNIVRHGCPKETGPPKAYLI